MSDASGRGANPTPQVAANGGPSASRKRSSRRREARVVRGPEDRVGELLNATYKIERLIAVGGMGAVYEVSHTRLEQHFAVKFLDPAFAHNQEAYSRFRREAEIASNLINTHVVQVFDFNTDTSGNPYMVMELVDGRTLDEVLAVRKSLKVDDVLSIYRPLCGALDACHEAGIVHRDLKPSNIIVNLDKPRPVVKLLDFGISKIKQQDSDPAVTRDNVVMGTPNYMSPEQAQGQNKAMDKRTDVFALGAILYELLSGRRAFDADSLPSLLHAIVYDEPTPLRNVTPAVYDVIKKALMKDPVQRFQGAGELLHALEQALRGTTAQKKESKAPFYALWGLSIVLCAGVTWAATASRTPNVAPTPLAASNRLASSQERAVDRVNLGEDEAASYAKVLDSRRSSIFIESQGQLYTADMSGLNYWSDPGATPRRQALASPSAVTTISVGAGDEILVGQEDGSVSRWDRTLRDNRGTRVMAGGPILALTSGADYLAVALQKEIRLVNLVNGKGIKNFPSAKPPRALAMVRANSTMLLAVVREDDVEIIDADHRRSLGVVPLGARQAVGAGVSIEKVDQDPAIWIDFLQGEWMIRREFAIGSGSPRQPPRFEMISQKVR
jgi:serine/threonine protein kinase